MLPKQTIRYGLPPLLLLCTALAGHAAERIALTPDMVIAESFRGDATMLVDEQERAYGVLDDAETEPPEKMWMPGYNEEMFPATAVLDLGMPYELESVYLLTKGGKNQIIVRGGKPFEWDTYFDQEVEGWTPTHEIAVGKTTQYVQIELVKGTNLLEVVITGKPAGKPAAPKQAAAKVTPPTVDALVGLNAFIDDPIDKIAVATAVREYHVWAWDVANSSPELDYKTVKYAWNPSPSGGTPGWNFDEFYRKLHEKNILIAPVMQQTVQWISGAGKDRDDGKPAAPGADVTDPATYVAHAAYMFQYSARYGSKTIEESRLQLAENQEAKTGLGYVNYIENWNEQDKTWHGPEAFFTPYAYAAMSSADRDGHQGKLGENVGMHAADPTMKLVMGGIADARLSYIKAMKLWCDYHRGGDFAWDAINVHHYSHDADMQLLGKKAWSPEAGRMREKMAAFVKYRDQHLPGKEVWITEFGYDSNPNSPQGAPAIGKYTPMEVQAQWMVRSYLALAASGIDRAFMFMLRDVNSEGPYRYNTSGLVTGKGSWDPKPSWYYLYTMRNTLTGMRFVSDVKTGNEKVMAYGFADEAGTRKALAVWCPTSDGTVVENFTCPVPEGVTSVELVTLAHGKQEGEKSPATIENGKVTVTVTEAPLFLVMQ